MGLLKSIGRGIKRVGKGIGKAWEKIDDYALPAVGFALGGPAGAALGSAAARGIGDGKFNAKATLGAGVKGYVGGQLAGMAGVKGGQGVGSMLSSGKSALTNPGVTASRLVGGGGGSNFVAGGGAPGGGGVGGTIRSIGGFLKDNPDLILAGASAVQGSRQQGKADKMNQRALDMAEQRYRETAGLREMGMDRLLNTPRLDLSAMYQTENPFGRPLRPLSPTMGGTTPRGPQADDIAERPMREVTQPVPPLPSVGGRRRFV